ncbi:hypothetical protein F0562_027565 [Nyssa sinensis]|uniref:ZCF37 n=1 Tax=Nyssa sinensis TaxID=561372 RepID=A0A5J5B3L2_9ASTE|nr:hypothetical protein F0562_027565 [Nyssa sinensis]
MRNISPPPKDLVFQSDPFKEFVVLLFHSIPKSIPKHSFHFSQMFKPFVCGSFHHQEEEDDEPWSPRSPPRKSRKSSMCRSSRDRDSKNPYAKRGLDKFSALLADLEDQRQKIYTEMGTEDISFVRFAYSNSNDLRPIVVKVRDRKNKKTVVDNLKNNPEPSDKHPLKPSEIQEASMVSDQKTKKTSCRWEMKFDNLGRPSVYLPAIIILILLLLAIFGRSFAILCTSIGWYLVPTIKAGRSNLKRPRKIKKDQERKLSEDKIISDGLSSPRSVITGAMNDNSPRQHGHRKSW